MRVIHGLGRCRCGLRRFRRAVPFGAGSVNLGGSARGKQQHRRERQSVRLTKRLRMFGHSLANLRFKSCAAFDRLHPRRGGKHTPVHSRYRLSREAGKDHATAHARRSPQATPLYYKSGRFGEPARLDIRVRAVLAARAIRVRAVLAARAIKVQAQTAAARLSWRLRYHGRRLRRCRGTSRHPAWPSRTPSPASPPSRGCP